MNTPYTFRNSTRPIVYVRPVDRADLPADVLEQLPQSQQLYAIHHEEGARMAIVSDRKLAFFMARENDYDPVSVH
jgi:hypothetical protein